MKVQESVCYATFYPNQTAISFFVEEFANGSFKIGKIIAIDLKNILETLAQVFSCEFCEISKKTFP